MKRRFLLFVAFLLVAFATKATHNRAGEITFEYVGPYPALTYKVTITTFTRTSSVQADRPSLDSVHWGDNSPTAVFVRSQKINLGNDISKNIYIGYHTYPGNGTYVIYFEDPNRNEGVVNIPNSVDVPFFIESVLIIDPYRFPNNSPVLTYPPIDRGCTGRTFIHNANAYDPDGDSLSYELTVCRGAGGAAIPGYTIPVASSFFRLDSLNGDLIWNAPVQPGEYNVAFRIVSWRNGVYLGYVTRDMQILIGQCNNNPPEFLPLSDTCVIAGDTLDFLVTAIDPDGHNVLLSATGGPFQVDNRASFLNIQTNNDTAISRFNWFTNCDNVRKQPYYAQFKAQDVVPFDSISLVNLKGVFIYVYGPPPPSLNATAFGSTIELSWQPTGCSNVLGYRIYRRSGSYPGTIPCPCDNGAPSYTGYQLIDTTLGNQSTYYVDDNQGAGLVIGVEYCYIVTAVYPDGAESCASPQACATLRKDLPVITNADVRNTGAVNGSVYVAWSKPNEIDSVQFPGPYQYRVFHSAGITGASFTQFAVLNSLNDTILIDTLIDTQNTPWSYRVELWYTDNGTLKRKGASTIASTIYLTLIPNDNKLTLSWELNVPWTNSGYDIFKLNPATSQYDSIGFSAATTYIDTGLVNGQTYCYYVRSTGSYTFSGFVNPIINRSQRACGSPVDNEPPCSPQLSVLSSCVENLNELVWTNPNNSCADDVLKYYIYFAPGQGTSFERIDSLLSPFDTTYIHRDLSALTGCYRVTGVDSVGNETVNPVTVCVDSCQEYVLPSVFTPNGDGINDLFHPCDSTTSPELQETNCPPYRNVKDIDLKIFNRWGVLVFETTDRDVNWDGTELQSGAECPDGVYFYTCKVNFYRLNGTEPVELNGYVHLLRGGK